VSAAERDELHRVALIRATEAARIYVEYLDAGKTGAAAHMLARLREVLAEELASRATI